jgi:hypothetical protein
MNPPNNTTPPPSKNWKVVLRAAPDDLLIQEYRRRVAQQTAAATAAAAPGPLKPVPKAGRQAKAVTCPFCQQLVGSITEAKRHEPACRRKHLLYPGARFPLTLNQEVVTVELIRPGRQPDSWETFNVETGRPVFVRSPRALHGFLDGALFRGREGRLNPNATIPPPPPASPESPAV